MLVISSVLAFIYTSKKRFKKEERRIKIAVFLKYVFIYFSIIFTVWFFMFYRFYFEIIK